VLCEVCKENDVVITVTEIDGNGVRQVRLCEQCAAERGLQASVAAPPPAVTDFLQSVQQHISPSQTDAVRCSFCSSTLRDFRQTGRLGCPYCYTAFEQSLRELLRKPWPGAAQGPRVHWRTGWARSTDSGIAGPAARAPRARDPERGI